MVMNAADAGYIRALVQSDSAIVLDQGKEYLIESRLAPLVRETGTETLERFVAKLRSAPAGPLRSRVVEAITTNETNFFRDHHPWEGLRQTVLPALVAARSSNRQLNIWCGASSSGQEPYSLAMTLAEHFPELGRWTVKIIATDISTAMLARAREARYTQLEINRGLPAPLLAKYFERDGTCWRLKRQIRDMVDYREMNLAGTWPGLAPADLVLMRNVLIYFDVATKSAILHRVAKQLKPGGFLFLGGAETTLNLASEFERVQQGKAAWYRLKEGQK